jgi:hypothetical protein
MTQILLYHAGLSDSKIVLADTITPSGKVNLEDKPDVNVDGPSKVHTQTFENLKIELMGVHYVHPATTTPTNVFTWDDLLTIYRTSYDDTNPVLLKVVYGAGDSEETLTTRDRDGNSLPYIKCILETFSYPLNVKETRDAYIPVGRMSFRETD